MKIGHIAAEISPIAKVGGLADVVYGLTTASSKAGHEVFVIIPAYEHLKKDFFTDHYDSCETSDKKIKYHVFKKKLSHVTIYGIEITSPKFHRDSIYGGESELKYFLYFSKIASELILQLKPDVIHGHDWQASFALYEIKRLKNTTPTVLTLHNLQYQGKVPQEELVHLGISSPLAAWMLDPKDKTFANLLKMGIESADRITTVSTSFHNEILQGQNAFGLENTLLIHRHKFLGLLNGIDFDYFDPFSDTLLYHKYPKKALKDAEALKDIKKENLKHLLIDHQKPYDDRFTVCSITRLADQKAPFLILYALKKVVDLGGRFILVGSLHGSDQDDAIINFLRPYENHPQVIVELNTNSAMAHRTYASSHAIIVPSLFEPCGLTQMIALRYGTIPLVRATGGLKDTVFDLDTSIEPVEKRNGFTFDFPDQGGIDWVIDRSMKLYQEYPEKFWSLALKNLKEDHSWDKAAEGYLELYQRLTLGKQTS